MWHKGAVEWDDLKASKNTMIPAINWGQIIGVDKDFTHDFEGRIASPKYPWSCLISASHLLQLGFRQRLIPIRFRNRDHPCSSQIHQIIHADKPETATQ